MSARLSLTRRLWIWLTLFITGCAGSQPLPTGKPPLVPTPTPVTLNQLVGRAAPPLRVLTPNNADQVRALATLGTGALRHTIWRPDGSLIVGTELGLLPFDPIAGSLGAPVGPAAPGRLLAALPDGRLLLSRGDTLGSSDLMSFDVASGVFAPFPISGPLRIISPPEGPILALTAVSTASPELLLLEGDGPRTLLTLNTREPSLATRSSDALLLALDAIDYSTTPPRITIDILALPSGQIVHSLTGLTYVPDELRFVPGTSLLIVRESGGLTSVWDAGDGRRLRNIGTFGHITVTPDGTRFAAFDGTALRLWEVPSWRELPPLTSSPEADAILAETRGVRLSFSPDGAILLASGSGGLAAWEIEQPGVRPSFHPFTAPLRRVAFGPDGTVLASVGGRETTLWELASGLPRWRQSANSPAFAFEPDGQTLLLTARSVSGDQLMRRELGGEMWVPLEHQDPEHELSISPTGETFVGSFQAVLALRDAASGAVVRTIEARPTLSGSLSGVAGGSPPVFSPNGTLLAAGVDEQARIWDVADGREVRRLTHQSSVSRVQQVLFSPDSRLLASVALDGVRLWNVAEAREMRYITPGEDRRFIGRVAFSPDGSLLAATTWLNGDEGGGEIRIFETATGKLLSALSGHLGPVTDVAFAPSGALLASVATDGTVRLWGIAND